MNQEELYALSELVTEIANEVLQDKTIDEYHPNIILTILEGALGPIEQLKLQVKESSITLTEEEIRAYLDKKFEEDDPELKARLKDTKPVGVINLSQATEESIAEAAKSVMDRYAAAKYSFDPFTLGYFVQYCEILQNKARNLLDIIEKIAKEDFVSIADVLADLDIAVDTKHQGRISKEDMIRLVAPTVCTISDLENKFGEANNLETYLTFKLSKEAMYKEGIMPGELFPTRALQRETGLLPDYRCVPLSDRQSKALSESRISNFSKWLNRIYD